MPIFGQTIATLSSIESSIKMEEDFFSVAMTMPLDATDMRESIADELLSKPLIPRLVVPCETAARACSIWTSLPLGEKTVRE